MGHVFDGYSGKARRAIFFARHEAGQFDSPVVESEPLLLGIMREDKAFMKRLVASSDLIDSIRTQIEVRTPVQREMAIVTPPEMLKDRAAGSPVSFESVRKLIEANPFFHEKMAKSVNLPLSDAFDLSCYTSLLQKLGGITLCRYCHQHIQSREQFKARVTGYL